MDEPGQWDAAVPFCYPDGCARAGRASSGHQAVVNGPHSCGDIHCGERSFRVFRDRGKAGGHTGQLRRKFMVMRWAQRPASCTRAICRRGYRACGKGPDFHRFGTGQVIAGRTWQSAPGQPRVVLALSASSMTTCMAPMSSMHAMSVACRSALLRLPLSLSPAYFTGKI